MVGKGTGENSGANVRFPDVAHVSPRNAAISADQNGAIYDENEANFARREVLISKTISVRTEWGKQSMVGRSRSDDWSRSSDA